MQYKLGELYDIAAYGMPPIQIRLKFRQVTQPRWQSSLPFPTCVVSLRKAEKLMALS